ncbi:UNVERIFIED_ORG: enoyl-CoA hydratase/carnithine racemase [Pseudomonas cremoricolorata]|nr:enoyl-CoA hydratase/carnithine racemase [Pseudomonas cremoricolorata]
MSDSHDFVTFEVRGKTAIVTLNRPEKRNSFSQRIFSGLREAFAQLTDDVRAVVIAGSGDHFCAGLDLSEHQHVPPFESVLRSREGHRLFEDIQSCGRPVITAMQGAVIGGGLELACSTHIRVADRTVFYQLPEGRRGIFLGGGGSVRIAKVIGVSRLTEMMLTGRKLDAATGDRFGLSHYLVEPGESLKMALEIAENVAGNAQISNYLMLNALAQIGEMPDAPGLFTEAVAQALTLTTGDAKAGIEAFLQKRDIRF